MADTMLHQTEQLTQARIDIARLEEIAEAQGAAIARLESSVANLTELLQSVRDDMNQAKGGWRTLMLIGGVSATVGAGLAWLVDHLLKRIH